MFKRFPSAVVPALVLVLFLGAYASAQSPPLLLQERSRSQRPNVVLLMADDLGYGDVGFNGNAKIITPHLDRLAREGIRFDHFYAAAPLCSPTRASCLTGRSPFRQGIFAAHTGGLRPAETTLAELLQRAGYRSGFFGKWHLGWLEPDKVETRGFYSPPWHHGFEEVFATKSAVPTWNPTRTPAHWTGFGAREDGTWGGSIYIHNGSPATGRLDGDDSRIIMDRALPFIGAAVDAGEPFLATIWFHAPHEPTVAGPDYLARYPGLPAAQQHLYGCITAMDEQIGRLRTFLADRGVAQDTLVFFCSDNGPADGPAERGIASAGPFRGHKHQMWEGGLRVPSLMAWPGHLRAGGLCSFPAGTVDYLPTLLELLGVSNAKKRPLDGISLVPVLKGRLAKRPVPLAFGYQRLYKDIELYALIQDAYKICIPDQGETLKLFDLDRDPGETTDLARSHPDVLRWLEGELESVKAAWRDSREGKDYTW